MSSRLSYSKGLAIPVVLIKEYAYCPRYAYHMVFTNGINRVTESMQLSPMVHATQHNQLIKNLCSGLTVLYEVPLSSGRLGIYGKVDAVCLGESEAVVIELKPLSGISARSLRTRHRHYLYDPLPVSVGWVFHCGGLGCCPICCGVSGFVLGVVVRVGYRPTGSSEARE